MKALTILLPLALVFALLPIATVAQEDEAAAAADGEKGEEECEEAWEFMEFLKGNIKEKIETVLQETLFNPQSLLEQTVADTMSQVLVIRDDVLGRVKKIRTGGEGEDSITICEGQGIKQEEFLSDLRLDVMTVLLQLIESDAATPEALKEIGKTLLSIRTKVNGKITQLIMLREGTRAPTPGGDCAGCEILSDIVKGLDEVIEGNKNRTESEEEGGEGGEEVKMLTMLLMTIDARVGALYNEILAELEEGPRMKKAEELKQLKAIAGNLNTILSDMVAAGGNKSKINRLVSRDCVKVKNEVKRLLDECAKTCGTDACEACGAKAIDEVRDRLSNYNISIISIEDEDDAKESIRSDLITYLTQLNEDMTGLLTTKIESEDGNTLEECDRQTLEVINSIKAPLWMLVNTTLFGDKNLVYEMIVSLDVALLEMRSKYCKSGPTTPPTDDDTCDLEEIDQSYEWIDEIDSIISEYLFKLAEQDPAQARKDTMLGFVELRAKMEERVKTLYQNNLVCPEESAQIKNFYSDQLTKCIAEMMNPKYRFENKSRQDRVACIKQLRVTIENRRGDLLLREIEKRIQGLRDGRNSNVDVEDQDYDFFGLDIRADQIDQV